MSINITVSIENIKINNRFKTLLLNENCWMTSWFTYILIEYGVRLQQYTCNLTANTQKNMICLLSADSLHHWPANCKWAVCSIYSMNFFVFFLDLYEFASSTKQFISKTTNQMKSDLTREGNKQKPTVTALINLIFLIELC